jgi:two-component system, NarL family, sensor kinase
MQGLHLPKGHRDPVSLCIGSESSAAYLNVLIENSPIAIVVLDADHRCTMTNPAFEQLFQYTIAELYASDLDSLIVAPEMMKEASTLTHLVLQGKKVHTVTQRRRKDGMIVDVEIYGIPLIFNGRLTGVYALYQDVTERNNTLNAYRHITDQLKQARQEEQLRIARDLHDSTSQELAALNWNLHRLMRVVADGDEAARDLVKQTKELALECSERIRTASYLMHPPFLGTDGLGRAIVQLAERFEERSGIRVNVSSPAALGRFSNDLEVTVFRIVQEALANVLRHSRSPVVKISLHQHSTWLKLTIADEGTNTDADRWRAEASIGNPGTGIRSMRERLERLGGVLNFSCSPNGAVLVADIPLEDHLDG